MDEKANNVIGASQVIFKAQTDGYQHMPTLNNHNSRITSWLSLHSTSLFMLFFFSAHAKNILIIVVCAFELWGSFILFLLYTMSLCIIIANN